MELILKECGGPLHRNGWHDLFIASRMALKGFSECLEAAYASQAGAAQLLQLETLVFG